MLRSLVLTLAVSSASARDCGGNGTYADCKSGRYCTRWVPMAGQPQNTSIEVQEGFCVLPRNRNDTCTVMALPDYSTALHNDCGRGMWCNATAGRCECNITTPTGKTVCNQKPHPELGVVAIVIAVVFFGSNFVPTKLYDSGDGFYFQWAQNIGIWCVGLVVMLIMKEPQFHWIPMLGGAIWATGNCTAPFIISKIGLGLGMSMWSATNMLAGWASGAFVFGQHTGPFDYIGVGLGVCAIVMFLFIKPESSKSQPIADPIVSPMYAIRDAIDHNGHLQDDYGLEEKDPAAPLIPSDGAGQQASVSDRVIGCSVAIVAGLMYGCNFDPAQFLMNDAIKPRWNQEKDIKYSPNGLDYVFCQFCGSMVWSTVIFMGYCFYKFAKKETPNCNRPATVWAIISGMIWGIAQSMWFIANTNLNMVISFPLISIGAPLVAQAWGTLVFREVTGKQNYMVLGLAFFFIIACAGLIAYSHSSGS